LTRTGPPAETVSSDPRSAWMDICQGNPSSALVAKAWASGVSEQGAIRHQGALAYGELAIANGLASVVANQNQAGIGYGQARQVDDQGFTPERDDFARVGDAGETARGLTRSVLRWGCELRRAGLQEEGRGWGYGQRNPRSRPCSRRRRAGGRPRALNGAVSYLPAMFGLTLAGCAVQRILAQPPTDGR
jgi:hypothetical protein